MATYKYADLFDGKLLDQHQFELNDCYDQIQDYMITLDRDVVKQLNNMGLPEEVDTGKIFEVNGLIPDYFDAVQNERYGEATRIVKQMDRAYKETYRGDLADDVKRHATHPLSRQIAEAFRNLGEALKGTKQILSKKQREFESAKNPAKRIAEAIKDHVDSSIEATSEEINDYADTTTIQFGDPFWFEVFTWGHATGPDPRLDSLQEGDVMFDWEITTHSGNGYEGWSILEQGGRIRGGGGDGLKRVLSRFG